ncbi:MAG TPA: prolyl oligopeptidase family serine peptidase [Candidatus Dormibacteraeota bacterium]|jgi:dipeptidyl aminopeptidase/acylaminoacyl peptidase
MPSPITPDDLYRFRWIDHVRLSPDGERVAYQISWADGNARQNRSRIVVRRLLDPEPVGPTGGVQRDHSPEWSPDGRSIAFISRVGAADQLFVLEVGGPGPARQMSSVHDGVGHAKWSPDGKWIAFVGAVVADPDAVIDDPRPPDSRDQLRRAPVARVVRTLDYKHDGRGYVDGRLHHLFVVPSGGGDAKQLTDGAWDISDYDWSPDSAKIVVAGNAEPNADLQRELNLYLVDLDAKRVRLGGGFLLSSPIWSPKGDMIAFLAPNGLDVGLIERLWVVPLAGGGPRCLTLEFDQAVNDSVINDMRAGHLTRTMWSEEGDRIYFLAAGPGKTQLKSVDLEGHVRDEAGGRRRIYDFDVAKGTLVFCASDPKDPGELYMLSGGAEARMTDLNPWLRDRYVAELEQHYFTAPDGWKLEGWILKPPGFDESKLYPAVMEIHGGPHAQYGWSFFHELQILSGMGFVVFFMNPRGSDGYGETFRRAVVRDWGGKDYVDLMTSLDQVIDLGFIDAKRIGVGGGSYGGFMTNWIIGQTDRFSAAVSMRSISNLVSEYPQHDIVLWGVLQLGPPPWPNLEEMWRRSPIRYVQNMKTPLLLTAGEMDLRCAISQSEELFGAMRLLGKTVELVRFPEESHDLSRNGRPDRRVERLRRIAAWYERYVGTAVSERPVVEESTQVLPVPAEAPHEWAAGRPQAAVAETVAVTSRSVESLSVGEEPMSRPPVEQSTAAMQAATEPEVIQPTVSEFATREAPIVEPEALPELPSQAGAEPAPAAADDEAPAVAISEPVAGEETPPPAFADGGEATPAPPPPPLEPEPEVVLEAEPEPAIAAGAAPLEPAEVEPELEPELEPAVAAAPPAPEPEPEPELVSAITEPVLSAFAEPDAFADQPEAGAAEATVPPPFEPLPPQPAEPEPAPAAAAATFEEPVAATPAPESVQATVPRPPGVSETLVAWPAGSPGALRGNGAPAEAAFEEATSVIPAWQPAEADSKQTVSMSAMPPEEVASGAGFAALLTFESGPFSGRIVALPDQMVSIGRAPDNDVVVGDPATSGHHGRIETRSGSFWISDLGSTNGTLVNGQPVIEKQLSDGDMIAIGQNTMRFTLEA